MNRGLRRGICVPNYLLMKGKKRWDLTHSSLVYPSVFIVLAVTQTHWIFMIPRDDVISIILYKTNIKPRYLIQAGEKVAPPTQPLLFCWLISTPRYSAIFFSTGRGYPYLNANNAARGILNCFRYRTTFRRRVSHLLFIMSFFPQPFLLNNW